MGGGDAAASVNFPIPIVAILALHARRRKLRRRERREPISADERHCC
ncbi:MAG: hypothetical protein ACRDSJ_07435 [Rubrobacteraceae bacterium]